MFDLSGRRALVTGATGGIGEAIARALHAQGASLVVTGRRGEVLDKLAADLGERVTCVVADLGEAGATDALMKAAEADGAVDILVNNAGITRDTLAMRMKDDDWSSVLETNLSAVFRLSRAGIKGMMKRRHGRIINIGSIVGTTGNPGQANYAAAKAGLVGMTKALAAELGSRGITVNCVAPGFIDTAMTQKLDEKQKEALLGNIPSGRLGVGADIAAAVVYLASDEAAYVTGQTLHVNGGMAMI
ncbi:3-oxoacyl-[acyl-carrier-protein] reductase [Geminicoccus roseus]|uniref:3-oxoacyl-[acyl-carrier-protein] reductase n=1 Tax=Geminicoccus roseus TaxID=404900 RepID=UPI000426AEB6|nr:3-oxoacyl-[acyl-carrier-protein] reductase [Geminicoccus roseus]